MQRDFQYYEELLSGLEGILQADGTVEHQMAGGAVLAVRAEIAQTHELIGRGRLGVPEAGLHLAAGEHRKALRVQAIQEVLVRAVGLLIGKQVVVQPDLRVHAVLRVHPVERGTLDLAAVGGVPPLDSGS